MAGEQTTETVTVVRPLKVMALVCGIISILLIIISIASTEWLTADGNYRQGLWQDCQDGREPVCQNNPAKAWIQACAALCIITLIFATGATILTVFGLLSKNSVWKFRFYRIAMIIMFFCVLCQVISLIVFPAMFMQEIQSLGKSQWMFGWSYGVGWGAAIFLFGGAILLLMDKESEEIYYREKTYYDNQTDA
ncbi:unnamed protein product [Owenia fusiformis]|uniref:Transmembrane protein 47-like n=1 Tax=Owenia fusiformis TaxID=6347 RepID=A0A8S4N1L0_OWEFU|nr:unnamed protein product [Owenia fusiformis]